MEENIKHRKYEVPLTEKQINSAHGRDINTRLFYTDAEIYRQQAPVITANQMLDILHFRTGYSGTAVKRILGAYGECLVAGILTGNRITLPGVGHFKSRIFWRWGGQDIRWICRGRLLYFKPKIHLKQALSAVHDLDEYVSDIDFNDDTESSGLINWDLVKQVNEGIARDSRKW